MCASCDQWCWKTEWMHIFVLDEASFTQVFLLVDKHKQYYIENVFKKLDFIVWCYTYHFSLKIIQIVNYSHIGGNFLIWIQTEY